VGMGMKFITVSFSTFIVNSDFSKYIV